MHVLELDDLCRRYGNTVALDHLSLTVKPGEVFGFLGPNGAGKTTAMRAILGLVALDSGNVRWEGRQVGPDDKRFFGYLPEERGLYPNMKVAEQLIYLGRLHGMGRTGAAHATSQWLERLGLGSRRNAKVEALSLGNQQRVQLAAAMIHGPQALILDEPFSGLDPSGVDEMTTVLRTEARSGKVVLFSSHQLDLVEDICESAAIVKNGRTIAAGTIEQLTSGGQRRLVIRLSGSQDASWVYELNGVNLSQNDRGTLRLTMAEGTDPQAVLKAAQSYGTVEHFALERRRMSEVFREAVSPDRGDSLNTEIELRLAGQQND